jgi:predicted dehydrogenase
MLSFAHVHAHDYARQVRAHGEAVIQCIWDDDEGRGREAARTLEVPFEPDLTKVLESPEVDAVLINAPTSQHTDLLLAAAAHKKHIFTEKALTVSTADADRVVRAVRHSGVKFMISLLNRTAPEILFLKSVLDQGLLGKVTLMRARIAHMASLDHWFHDGSAWFADAALAGGGALFDLGCHTVDIMRWFLGEPVSVIAKVQNFSGTYPIDDNCVAVVEFANGALGILDTGWVTRVGPNPIEIYGTEGYVSRGVGSQPKEVLLAGRTLTVGQYPSSALPWVMPTDLPRALPMPFPQWVGACLHDTPMTITVEDGRNLTQMLEGIYTAARTGSSFPFAAESEVTV